VFDPQKNLTYSIGSFTGGNASLKPEASLTTTAGFTYSPSNLSGFLLSVDYYDIDIANAIGTISPQQAVTLCAGGNQNLCSTVNRDGNGFITTINANSINFTNYQTSGIDATFQYMVPVELPGVLNIRNTFTYVSNFTTNNGLSTLEYVESQGDIRASLGVPRVITNTTLGYDTDDYGGYLRGRFLSAGYYDRTRQIQNNAVPAFFYVDAGAHLNVGIGTDHPLQLTATVVNLLDRDPPIESQFSPYYDIVGRYIRIGAAYDF
jgi:iron complex outermembrane recepter protein